MDKVLLENILNEFANIQRDEEFYRDISGLMEPLDNEEFVYTDLSKEDLLKSKGILVFSNEYSPEKTELQLHPNICSLRLKKGIAVNLDRVLEEVDLDNKVIRLSNILEDSPDNTVIENLAPKLDEHLSSVKGKLSTMSERGQGPDSGHMWTVVPKINENPNGEPFYSYHWSTPMETDYFMMPNILRKEKRVMGFRSHPRAERPSALTKKSELTPEEIRDKIFGASSNLGTYLTLAKHGKTDGELPEKVAKEQEDSSESEDSEEQSKKKSKKSRSIPMRIYIPVDTGHKDAGYVRFYREKDLIGHPWDMSRDDSTFAYAIALAERLYGDESKQVDPESIIDFYKRVSGRNMTSENAASLLQQLRPKVDEMKKHAVLKAVQPLSDDEKTKGEFTSPGSIISRHPDTQILHKHFIPPSLGKVPIRPIESYGITSRDESRYKKAIIKMSKNMLLNGENKPALEHLMDHIETVLPYYQMNLEDTLNDPNVPLDDKKYLQAREDHDCVLLTYLARHFGSRLGVEKTELNDYKGISTLQVGNIAIDDHTGEMKIVYYGKGGSHTDIKVDNPVLRELLLKQIEFAKATYAKRENPEKDIRKERLFISTPNFYDEATSAKKAPLHEMAIEKLGLKGITGYNFRHYRATEAGIRSGQEEGLKVGSKLIKELEGLNPAERFKRIKELYSNLDRIASDLDINASGISNTLNYILSHVPSSTSWSSYIDPKYIKMAYKRGLKKVILDAYLKERHQ